jgi:alpha-methylacyl-CoA racemase
MSADQRQGPLLGIKVVEFASIGPGPHCAMLLADLGADVLRIDRPGAQHNPVVDRGRSRLAVDIRSPAGADLCKRIVDKADVLIEGLRPGVMERLGLGPQVLCERNSRLVYGRMTGWGQTGPLSKAAGHDLNYIALTGALAAMGTPGEPPVPPLNLVGDFGGGSVYLAFGILAALWERNRSGLGQVIDAAIVDGVASLMSMFSGMTAVGSISLKRDRSMLGGAAHFYRCYTCADGKYVAIGAIETQFYEQLVRSIGADESLLVDQQDVRRWPERCEIFAKIFRTKTRDEWCEKLQGTDCCFAPILTLEEAPSHAHNASRRAYFNEDGVTQPAPAPRFSRTPGGYAAGHSNAEPLARWGVT